MLWGLVGHGHDALLSSLFSLVHVLLNFPEDLVVFGFSFTDEFSKSAIFWRYFSFVMSFLFTVSGFLRKRAMSCDVRTMNPRCCRKESRWQS